MSNCENESQRPAPDVVWLDDTGSGRAEPAGGCSVLSIGNVAKMFGVSQLDAALLRDCAV